MMLNVDRSMILAYADEHGAPAASKRFNVAASTIRSWRSRGSQSGAQPGDEGWRTAELSRLPGSALGPVGAHDVLVAFAHAQRDGAVRAGQHIGVTDAIVRAWQARDAGEEPDMPDSEVHYRILHALAQLPPDVRCQIALDVEARAWRYLAPDLRHHRIVAEREAREHAERDERRRQEQQQATERDEREQAERAEAERLQRQRAEAGRVQVRAEREQAAAESEAMRRASEEYRRIAEAEAPELRAGRTAA